MSELFTSQEGVSKKGVVVKNANGKMIKEN